VSELELAFVLVKSKMGHEMEVMNDILKIDGVKEVMGTYGQYDIFVKVRVSTRTEIEKVVTKKIRAVPNVISTTTLDVIPEQEHK
jgi:DNA-binding Lrp family transcriptional regulator